MVNTLPINCQNCGYKFQLKAQEKISTCPECSTAYDSTQFFEELKRIDKQIKSMGKNR